MKLTNKLFSNSIKSWRLKIYNTSISNETTTCFRHLSESLSKSYFKSMPNQFLCNLDERWWSWRHVSSKHCSHYSSVTCNPIFIKPVFLDFFFQQKFDIIFFMLAVNSTRYDLYRTIHIICYKRMPTKLLEGRVCFLKLFSVPNVVENLYWPTRSWK